MRQFKFFMIHMFLKRWIALIAIAILFFLATFFTFTATRFLASSVQGYDAIKVLDKEGNFILNSDISNLSKDLEYELTDVQNIYQYLFDHHEFAMNVYGFVSYLPNKEDMEVTVNYLNEADYNLAQFSISKGEDIFFDYSNEPIPVLLGAGLADEYPLGSVIEISDSATQKRLTLTVRGILKKDNFHPNVYSPDIKEYLNFSIIVPINEEFISQSGLNLLHNGLNDLVLLDTTREKANELTNFIQDQTGEKFNARSQPAVFANGAEYFYYHIGFFCFIALLFTALMTIISIWNVLMSVRLMVKELAINRLVGLSYTQLRKNLYTSFGVISLLNIGIVIAYAYYEHFYYWNEKYSLSVTYGIAGLRGIEWIGILTVVGMYLLVLAIIVETITYRVKKMPISLGVLE